MGHNIEHRTKKGKEILCILGAGAGAGAAAETAAAAHSIRIYSPPISAGGTECLVTLYCTLCTGSGLFYTFYTMYGNTAVYNYNCTQLDQPYIYSYSLGDKF